MDIKDYANIIVDAIGQDNIVNLTRCATRLRFNVNDIDAIDKNKIEAIEIVKGTVELNNQFQVFVDLGEIKEVYKEIEEMIK